MYRSGIAGTGSALPKKVLTNFDLEKMVETSDEWITTRTGIKERRIAEENEYLSPLAIEASQKALEKAGVDPEEIDLVICATVTPDQLTPSTANFIQEGLKAKRAVGFDISAGCSGFLFALSVADHYIKAGTARTALVIGAEVLSKYVNWKDRVTCIIFADGAGAVVLSRVEPPRGLLSTCIRSDGAMADYISIPAGGSRIPITPEVLKRGDHLIHMKGNETFKIAIRSLTEVSKHVLEEQDLVPDDVTYFIPHQANIRIIEAVGQRLKIPNERVFANIDRIGNTSAASIPIALDELARADKIRRGDILLMSAFGAGLTWGAALCRW